ncbi:flagellar filament capping protein FliD [Neptunomonas phycophila]|uniref:flagellar filament capping protein FliD n=1 Tax=Neptunomonas phycophila TaxID=1572645 RepID=UPI003518ACCD
MVSIVSALGAGSGIDTTSLVEQLVDVQRSAPQARLDTKKETLESQISAYGALSSSLSTLQDSIASLTSEDIFNSRAVSFPDTDVITPNELSANAQTGSYQLEVMAIAQAQTLVANQTFDDKDSSLNATGNLTIRLGAWSYDASNNPASFAENESAQALNIEVAADDTLQDIADKINETDSQVQASVLLVDGAYQLMINAPSGEDNALEITSDDASLSGFNFNTADYSSMTETLQGQDAEIKVNGLSVFRQSNEIDDVITGLDFTLNKASAGEKISFTISEDSATAEDEIRNFVDAYNTFYETAKSLTGISTDADTEETTAGTLASDGTAKAVISRIRSMMTTSVPGVEDFNALTNLGIRTQLDGTLEIVEDEFSAAIDNNFDDVAAIFAPKTSSSTSAIEVGMGSYSGQAVPGSYDVSITTSPSKGSVTSDSVFSAFNTADPGLNPLATPDYSFSVEVDGVASQSLTLEGDFTSADELRSALQSLINNDENIKAANIGVDVQVDDAGVISIVSREFGSASGVSITAQGDDFASATGLSTNSVSTAGTNVEGTINGEPAFGSGNILLPAVGSDAYGINLTIKEGALGDHTFNFSRGLASELSLLVDTFLDDTTGAIAMREDNINSQIDDIADDQDDLDRRMTMFEDRLTAQFTAMEAIITSLQTTGDSLSSLFDTLPNTASSN